jgi:hypothetical protein
MSKSKCVGLKVNKEFELIKYAFLLHIFLVYYNYYIYFALFW